MLRPIRSRQTIEDFAGRPVAPLRAERRGRKNRNFRTARDCESETPARFAAARLPAGVRIRTGQQELLLLTRSDWRARATFLPLRLPAHPRDPPEPGPGDLPRRRR